MAEDKVEIKKKTEETNEDIYALNLGFDDTEIIEEDEEKELVFLKGYDDLDEEENAKEEPKKKKV